MNKLTLSAVFLITFSIISCDLEPDSQTQSEFPQDFRAPIDAGGSGRGKRIVGFGGDMDKSQSENAAQVSRNVVIMVHGNGATALGGWGWKEMRQWLWDAGYNKSEVWGLSYLGSPPGTAQDYTTSIEDLRNFINAVRSYLNLDNRNIKIDIIGHSLGCILSAGFAVGLQSTGRIDNSQHRLHDIGSMIYLSGGNYGMHNMMMKNEFHKDFADKIHTFQGIYDATPWGSSSMTNQISPDTRWKDVTSLDNDRIVYVGIISYNDTVDQFNKNSSRIEGGDLNVRYYTGLSGMDAHVAIIQTLDVFENHVLPYLNVR